MPMSKLGSERIEEWLGAVRRRLLWNHRLHRAAWGAAVLALLWMAAAWLPVLRQHWQWLVGTSFLVALAWAIHGWRGEQRWSRSQVAAWVDQELGLGEALLTFAALRDTGARVRLFPALVARLLLRCAGRKPNAVVPLHWQGPVSVALFAVAAAISSWLWTQPPPTALGTNPPQVAQAAPAAAAARAGGGAQDRLKLAHGAWTPGEEAGEEAPSGEEGRAEGPPSAGSSEGGKREARKAGQRRFPTSAENSKQSEPSPDGAGDEHGEGGKSKSAPPRRAATGESERQTARHLPAALLQAETVAEERGAGEQTERGQQANKGTAQREQNGSAAGPATSGSSQAGSGCAPGGLFADPGAGMGAVGRTQEPPLLVTLSGLRYRDVARQHAGLSGAAQGELADPAATADHSSGAPLWKAGVPPAYREAVRRLYQRGEPR